MEAAPYLWIVRAPFSLIGGGALAYSKIITTSLYLSSPTVNPPYNLDLTALFT